MREDIAEGNEIKQRLLNKNLELEAIFENSHEGIIYLDPVSKELLSVNQRGLDILGLATQRALDLFLSKCMQSQGNGNCLVTLQVEQVTEAGKKEKSRLVHTHKLNGEAIWLSVREVLDTSDESQPKQMIFFADISKEHQAKIDLELKNEELQRYIESNIQLEQFAHVASHDLRAPIITIKSFSKLLSQRCAGVLGEEERQSLDYIESNAEQMYELVNDLLEYSQINSQAVKAREVDVQALVESLMSLLSIQAEAKGVRWLVPEKLPLIIADGIKLKRVFQNLLSNAIKFSDLNKASFIRITAQEESNSWRFNIEDNGVGMRESKVDIFLPYVQLNNKSVYKGTGLGLSICKKIVNQHGGTISYVSTFEEGSAFSFTIGKGLKIYRAEDN